jgi:type VI secretion system secreted protein VgrG
VGPAGEEIHTDAHGRIKVHFPWDREGTEHAPDTSCWLRVAQAWAGPGWGTLFLPRVGMEVVVSFVDGDPDRPLCTGCVYNGANRPPYALPDERTKSTIKTASSPGGEGFNELRFEDARGSEQVFIHAERDLDEVVKAAHTMSVGSTQQISVGADQTIAVDGSRVLTIKGSQSVRIDGGAVAGNSTVLGHELGVTGKIVIDATDQITVQSPVGVKFICGPTIVELTPSSILLYAGAGAMLQLGGAATLAAAGGATSLAMGDDGKAKLGSIAGGALAIDGQVVGTSAAGSKLVLEGSISAVAAAGAKLELTTDVSTHGQTITSQASGAKLVLDQAAALSGLSVTSSADAGKMIVDSNGATVEGAQVAISGVSLVSVAAALLKLN